MPAFPHWFVIFNGIADRWLWPFETDSWRLTYNDPALRSTRYRAA